MSRLRWLICGSALLFVVGACTSTTSTSAPSVAASASSAPSPAASTSAVQGGGGQTPSEAPTPTPVPTTAVSPTPAGSQGGAGNPPSIDPCSLLTDEQASAVNKVTYGPGVSHFPGRLSLCVWQSKSPPASVTVEVLVAPEATEAETQWVAAQAALHGFALTKVPGFADQAVIARAPGGFTGGIYVRDGATFFDVVYLRGTQPSDNVLKLAATLVLGHLP